MKSRHCAATNAPREIKTAAGLALVAGTLLLAGALPAQAQSGGNTGDKPVAAAKAAAGSAPSPAETKAQASYSLGVSFGSQLHSYGLSGDNVQYERVLQGLRDSLSGKVTAKPEDGQRIQAMIEQARAGEGAANKAAAAKLLAENGKQPGVVTTASGLEYKVIRPGAGETPKLSDEATVHYRGTLLNGTEFDSSYKRGQPATFTVNAVIKGWQEALLLMKPGEKIDLYIPPALAYDMNSPPPIPPGSLLKFEVELISVRPAPASSAPGGAPGGARHPAQ